MLAKLPDKIDSIFSYTGIAGICEASFKQWGYTATAKPGCYIGKMLRVDLTRELITEEEADEAKLRNFVGGTGLGVKILCDEVPGGSIG